VRIGILETDTLEPGIQEKYGSYAEMFQRLFLSVNDQLAFKVFPVIAGSYPDNIDDCDAYLITGSKSSAYDSDPWIKQLCDFIVALHKQRRKLIGICFGHQIIAQALGGKTQKSNKGWAVGNSISNIEKAKPWMANEKKQFALLVSHQDQVTRLPVQAELVATNAFCPNACFQIENHILTFQGHPEFSVDYLNYLLNKRRDIIGEEKCKKAIDSLQYAQDNQLVVRWIINFIHQ
jgi:GMP synthase-like glutamine amidotransferase